jgi:hypothetical protein
MVSSARSTHVHGTGIGLSEADSGLALARTFRTQPRFVSRPPIQTWPSITTNQIVTVGFGFRP